MAVYVASLWLGDADLPHRRSVRAFANGVGWLDRIGLFVMLGRLSGPTDCRPRSCPHWWWARCWSWWRPISVILCATPFRIPWREQAFMSIAGLRSAVPIVVATIPVSAGLFGTAYLFDIVFVLVVVFTALQASVIPASARRLGVIQGGQQTLEIDAAPLDEVKGDIITSVIHPGFRLQAEDRIVIVCLPGTRDATEQRLRDLDAAGRLAGWLRRAADRP